MHALAIGAAPAAFLAFSTAAATLVALLFLLSLTIALVEEQAMRRVRARVTRVKRWGGYVLLIVGGWTFLTAAFPAAWRPILF